MSASAGPSSYHYTEGASAIDISTAVANPRRARRESQYSLAYDDADGAMFDGPGHAVNPSSVSRMSLHRSLSRQRSEGSVPRRSRRGSEASRRTDEGGGGDVGWGEGREEDEEEEDITGERPLIRRGRRSPSPARGNVFGNIAQLFGRDKSAHGHRRRSSLSQRSTASSARRWGRQSDAGSVAVESDDEGGDERWGYSSAEEESEDDEDEDIARSPSPAASEFGYGSEPPSPTHSASLPLLSGDQFFGAEARIDVDLEPLAPPPPGAPSRQTIYIADEDASVRFVGYETRRGRRAAWRALCVLSAGVLGLLGHWFPMLWLRWVTRERAFRDLEDGFVVVEVSAFVFLTGGHAVTGVSERAQGDRAVSCSAVGVPIPRVDRVFEPRE